MNEERLLSFIRSFEREKSEELIKFREEAQKNQVPIVREETEALLSFFAGFIKPERILEIGTAVGYSGTVLLQASENSFLDTLEEDPARMKEAKKNFKKFGLEKRTRLYEGDATETLKNLEGVYDLIFLDAAKAQYVHWLEDVLRLLSPRGILITDNIFQEGDIFESHFVCDRRDRTIHQRMREFLLALRNDEKTESMLLSIGDGVLLTRKG